MNKQTLQARRIADAPKRKGALEAKLCWHGNALAVHIEMPSGEARSEVVYECGCLDIEVHRPAGASATIQSDINQ